MGDEIIRFKIRINEEERDEVPLEEIVRLRLDEGLEILVFLDKWYIYNFENFVKLANVRRLVRPLLEEECFEEGSVRSVGSVNSEKMGEKFDLKTAAGLIPVATEKEESVLTLIDTVELYESMIREEDKEKLMNFVLKTRLGLSAKLQLENKYENVKDLVTDMRAKLLPVKSAAKIMGRLTSFKQTGSLDRYCKDMEDMFNELSLAQQGSDEGVRKILRVENEKLAIQSFANGLKSTETRTVVKARGFKTLKEAIREAKEEEETRPREEHVLFNRHREEQYGFANRGRGFGYRGGPNRNVGGYFQQQGARRYEEVNQRGASRAGNFPRNVQPQVNVMQREEEGEFFRQ